MLAEVHVVRAEILRSAWEGFKIEEAIRELRLAQQLNPSVGHAELGELYVHLGLEHPAIRELEKAMEIDPFSEFHQNRLISGYLCLGRPDDAIAWHTRLLNSPGPLFAFVAKRRLDEAEPWIARELAESPEAVGSRAMYLLALAVRGKFAEAEAQIPQIQKQRKNFGYHAATYHIAAMYALQSKAQPAVKWLRETAENGLPSYLLFSRDPSFDPIRKDPAFVQFMAELKTRWEGYQREFQ